MLNGDVNRDRQRLTDPEEEAENLESVWEAAIDKSEQLVLPNYADLLQNHPHHSDVDMAEHFLEYATRKKIWDHMLKESEGQRFYYCEKSGHEEAELIKESLKKDPVPIPESLWDLLRSPSLIRTAQEERICMLKNAKPSSLPTSAFAQNVQRALKTSMLLIREPTKCNSCLCVAETMESTCSSFLRIIFLKLTTNGLISTAYTLSAHVNYSDLAAAEINSNAFFCDHIVEELYRLALEEILKAAKECERQIIEARRSLCYEVRKRLRQMSRILLSPKLREKGSL